MSEPRRRKSRRKLWIGIVAAVLIVGALAFALIPRSAPVTSGPPTGWVADKASSGTIDASVSATGTLAPRTQAEIRFSSDGTITEVLVTPGDRVTIGQPLAKLDPIDAQLGVARANSDIVQAKAAYEKLLGGAQPAELAQARASLAQAQAAYQQTLAKYSGSDVRAAQARLEQARAQLTQVQAGAKDTDVRASRAALEQTQTQLQADKNRLSASKSNAELSLQRATADLTRAQSSYATAKQNWAFIQETGQDPTNPEIIGADGKKRPNKLGDTQRQQYYDAFVSAESGLKSAEAAVSQSQIEYDATRQAEATGVTSAEKSVNSAQANFDKLTAGSDRDQIASAQASVASAQADLNRLTGADKNASVASAQAGVDSAQAAIDKLLAKADANDVVRIEADVSRAETALKQAQRALDQTTLTAPLAGTVSRVDLTVGERPGTTSSVVIVNLDGYFVDVPVDELDITQIKSGQPATVQLDALPDAPLSGKVTTIEPQARKSDKGTNTFQTRVELSGAGAAMPGMSANVQIITQQHQNATLIPRRAVQSENGQSFVYVPFAPGTPPAAPSAPGQTPPPGERRNVKLGLSNSQSVEVLEGLKPGDAILLPDVVQTINPNLRGGG